MHDHAYRVIPFNPSFQEMLARKCHPALRAIPGKANVVICFRKSEEIMPVAEDAFAIGAKVLCLQIGDPRRFFSRIYFDACRH